MKKIMQVVMITSLLLTISLATVHAQTIIAGISNDEYTAAFDKHENKEKINKDEANSKAVKNFERSFKNADNVTWYKTYDGYMVYFYQGGTKKVSGYGAAGNWIYNLVSYSGDKLPSEIWDHVKSVYYRYSITWVNEVSTGNKTIYVVHLEDKNSYKNVRVCDEEMDEIEVISKS